MKNITCYIFCLIWDIFVISGCAYLVGWHGWNPWWFAFVFLLLVNPKENEVE